jgi:uncharacterized membrane protein YdjX (TVP38/TMEM64 family)
MTTLEALRKVFFIAVVAVLALAAVYVVFTMLLCGLLVEAEWCALWPRFTISEIEDYIRASGPWGVAVSIGLMVVHSFIPFPGEFIAIANGMVYGVLWGTVITWVGARAFVHRMLKGRKAIVMEDWAERYGGGAVFISRFIPVISFNLINYAAGLTKVSWWTFAWATGLGILPITTLMVVLGSRMATMPWTMWLLFIGMGVAVWGLGHLLYVRRYGKK